MKHIRLTRGYVAKVDMEDWWRLSCWKWHVSRSGGTPYAVRDVIGKDGKRKKRFMHYEVLNLEQPLRKGLVVDHIVSPVPK